jgi:hypothetical protein
VQALNIIIATMRLGAHVIHTPGAPPMHSLGLMYWHLDLAGGGSFRLAFINKGDTP